MLYFIRVSFFEIIFYLFDSAQKYSFFGKEMTKCALFLYSNMQMNTVYLNLICLVR